MKETTGTHEIKFEPYGFRKRLGSMLSVDFRRMLTGPFFYIMVGIAFVIPILILVMTTMMDGSTTTDPTTGVVTTIEGFDNVWQAIGSVSGEGGMAMDMSLTGMCNINMMYFLIAVLVCVFISEDFRCGYAKNLFAVRAKKSDYVISKTLVGFFGGACMILAFFVGAMLGGAISGLPFDTGSVGADGIVMCLLSKVILVMGFVPIYTLASVIAKSKSWLSLLLSFGIGMLFFTMIPMLTPLNSTVANVLICILDGAVLGVGLGAISNIVLGKTSLV